MGVLQYFPWYPRDAESDAKYSRLTLSEVGLFHRCINFAWDNDGIPDTPDEIARTLRLPLAEVREAWPEVSRCFVSSEEGKLVNPRQERERQIAIERSLKASKAGKASGVSRTNSRGVSSTHLGSTQEERTFTETRTPVPLLPNGRSFLVEPPAYGDGMVLSSLEGSAEGNLSDPPTDPLAELGEDAFWAAWNRHHKRRNNEVPEHAVRLIQSSRTFTVARFRANHGPYCDHFDALGWNDYGNALTFCGWIQQGMPGPPPAAKPKTNNGRPSLEDLMGPEPGEEDAA